MLQKKMAELASRRGTDVDGAAAAKKAAFLKEAEEAVRRATMQVHVSASIFQLKRRPEPFA